ncbi:hypothetical protein [Limosilactobacillus caecicola]|uniref:hypothetical protein n=1 Tax=Limosilactobacillus caecicola TaxID=2941332 RepID=UPI0020403785|nr:hypothetical protein [Limosilactobacillus caecicola]
MKYKYFKYKVEAMGFVVNFKPFGATEVRNKQGQWLASVWGQVPYNFMINQDYWDMKLWGSEEKRRLLCPLVMQLASTEINNRGRFPVSEVAS